MTESETTVYRTATPPKLTVEAVKKRTPRMMTVSPGRAVVGLKLLITGGVTAL